MTTVPEEAVKAAQKAYRECEGDATESHRAALTAALPHLPGVGVKKLAWYDVPGISTAHDNQPRYCAIKTHNGKGEFSWSLEIHGLFSAKFDTLEAAKAAAQADYEARILSAIEFAPSVCQTCNGHGLVGGLIPWGDGEVDSVCEPCPDCAPSPRAQALEEAAVMLEAKAEAANSRAVAFTEKLSGPLKGRKKSEQWRSEKTHNERIKFYYQKAAAAIRALSSPDHADAGKVEGDGCNGRELMRQEVVLMIERFYSDYTWHHQLIANVMALPSAPSQEVAGS